MDAEPDAVLAVQPHCLPNLPYTLCFPCTSTGTAATERYRHCFFVAGQPVVRVSFLASGLMCSMSVACGALGSPGVLLNAALLDLHTAHQSSFVLKWLNFSTFVWFKLACTLWHYPVYFKCNTKMK